MQPRNLVALCAAAACALAMLVPPGAPIAEAQVAANLSPTTVDVADQPVVRVQLPRGLVTIKTWDRPQVQVESAEDLEVAKRRMRIGDRQGESLTTIPVLGATLQVDGQPFTLPPEDFVATNLSSGDHDAVVVTQPKGATPFPPTTPITLTVPASTGLVFVGVGGGNVDITGLKNESLVVRMGGGLLRLHDDGGAVFLQNVSGQIVVTDSNFERIRARTVMKNITFSRCNAKQIEVTSQKGSIVYDDGTFDPGLARFESDSGSIAIGLANGNAQFGTRVPAGRVYTSFDRPLRNEALPDGGRTSVGTAPGPLVNAATRDGSIYLYEGAYSRRKLRNLPWTPLRQALAGEQRAEKRMQRLEGQQPPQQQEQQRKARASSPEPQGRVRR